MKKYSATITINAPPLVVWEILIDAQGYPQWDRSMRRIDGSLAPGKTVTFHTTLSEQAFPVKVTAFEAGKKMVLTGGLPLVCSNLNEHICLRPRQTDERHSTRKRSSVACCCRFLVGTCPI